MVCVDWEGGATMPNYLRAAANTRLVGKQLAMLLNGKFHKEPSNVTRHLIGDTRLAETILPRDLQFVTLLEDSSVQSIERL